MPGQVLDPGGYVQEQVNPQAGAIAGIGTNLVIISEGSITSHAANEAHIRGQVIGETLIVASGGLAGPFYDQSDQNYLNTTLYANSIVLPSSAFTFVDSQHLQIAAQYYSATSVYTLNYVAINTDFDFLNNANATVIDLVGSFPNSANYKISRDYLLSGSNVDWLPATQAKITGQNAATFNIGTSNNQLYISVNGLAPLAITLTTGTAQTAANVVTDINTAFTNSALYGSQYGSVASASGNYVMLTAPVTTTYYYGVASVITLYTANTNDGTQLVFGVGISNMPYQVFGTGMRPKPGALFYVSYDYTRPASDYNVAVPYYSDTDFYNARGGLDSLNKLSQLGWLAWQHGVTSMYVIQVKSAAGNALYTDNDYIVAAQALIDNRNLTDIVCLRSTSGIRAAIKLIVEQESTLQKSNFKRYWIGAPIGTQSGDLNTVGTYVYIAQAEMYVTPTDPSRGRYILCAPDSWSLTITNLDGSQSTLTVDSNYAALADAALSCSFVHASDTLLKKEITLLTLNDPYNDTLRRYLTSNGVNVHTYIGTGASLLFNPVTTDVGGNIEFSEISASVQKDIVNFRILQAIDINIIAIVPDDLADFLGSIKTVAGGEIQASIASSDIGSYLDSKGVARDLDYTKDIIAWRSTIDPTTYYFRYWFMLKYPAKYIFGTFSVGTPSALAVALQV